MHSWGHVYSFEAQERLYYALAGNIAINNCFNATAYNRALGDSVSVIEVPEVNYLIPSSFGSLELKQSDDSEDIGQPINRKMAKEVSMISVDSLNLKRLDFLKIDVEGMEEDVLRGARGVISEQRPSMIVEYYKSEKEKLIEFLWNLNISGQRWVLTLLPFTKTIRLVILENFLILYDVDKFNSPPFEPLRGLFKSFLKAVLCH